MMQYSWSEEGQQERFNFGGDDQAPYVMTPDLSSDSEPPPAAAAQKFKVTSGILVLRKYLF